MYAEILHALLAVLAAVALVGAVVGVYRYGSSSERIGRSVMMRAVKSGEFIVRFRSDSCDGAEYVLRRLISLTATKEFGRWRITVVDDGMDEECRRICDIFAKNYACVSVVSCCGCDSVTCSDT